MAHSKSMTAVKRRHHAKKDAAADSAAFAEEEQVVSDFDDDKPAAKLQWTESPEDNESEHSSPVPEPVKPCSTHAQKPPAKKTSVKAVGNAVEKEKSQDTSHSNLCPAYHLYYDLIYQSWCCWSHLLLVKDASAFHLHWVFHMMMHSRPDMKL